MQAGVIEEAVAPVRKQSMVKYSIHNRLDAK
jgi:hypothetical protein